MNLRPSLWAPVIVYMALIFWLSSIPDPPDPPGALSNLSDKTLHAILYGGLTALVVRALAGGWLRPVTMGVAVLAAAIAAVYGITDEIHQHFVPRREMETLDAAADAIGASIASLGLYIAGRFR